MFVRQLRRKNTKNISVQIVRSYRNAEGRPRQKIVCHMGSAPEGELLDALMRAAEVERRRRLHKDQLSLFPAENTADKIMEVRRRPPEDRPLPIADARLLEERKRFTMGYHEVFGKLYHQLGFSRIWGARHRMSARLFRQAVVMRLAAPGDSKLGHSRKLARDHGVEVPVEKFYRMMDRLDDKRIEKLREMVSVEVLGLLGGEFEVVFFDVTTLWFASDADDGLKKKGWSKDGKHNRVQVVFALIQTSEGLPVGYELFPGNTADVKTLEPAVKKLRERHGVKRVVVVADAAMGSVGNRNMLSERGDDWVVAARLRKLDKESLERLWNYDGWTDVGEDKRVGELDIKGQRLVVRHCAKRARKDAHDRAKALERAKSRIKQVVKGGGRRGRFIKVDGVSIDEEALKLDEKFDGLHGVWTSLKDVPAKEVYRRYGELWRIERSFRVMKHTMAVRPVFHWTETRVKAHMAICFAAFALLRILVWRHNCFHGGREPLSEESVLGELGRVQASVVVDSGNGNQYLIPSSANHCQRSLYAAVGLKLKQRTVLVDPSYDLE